MFPPCGYGRLDARSHPLHEWRTSRSTSGRPRPENSRVLRIRARLIGAAVIVAIVLAGAIVLTSESTPVVVAGGQEHCFGEWCIAPQRAAFDTQVVTVTVRVRSDAKQASQRPDHPQVWVVDSASRQVGGPQHSLDRLVAPGDVYTSALTFSTSNAGSCPRLRISEGGWPPFLGLGYAASPFTATAEWRLCEVAR